MRDSRSLVAVLSVTLFLLYSFPSGAELPPLFEGDLNVCKKVQQERAKGRSLEEALHSVIQDIQPEEFISLASVQRTILHHAIRTCGYDPSTVMTTAYQAGIPLPLIVGSAEAAGVGRGEISSALVKAGFSPSQIGSAFARAETPREPSVTLFPSPDFEVGTGLGQASPSRP